MPLSEHEQRLLDQIERALYQEDPKFASTVRETDLRTHMRRRMRRAGLVLALGFVLLVVGVMVNPVIGIIGFVVMVGALLLAMTSWKRLQPGGATLRSVGNSERSAAATTRRSRPSKTARSTADGSFKQRLEQRWKRRWDERGGPS